MKSFWKIHRNRWQKFIFPMLLFLVMGPALMGATPINPNNAVSVNVANDAGPRFLYGGNPVYYINFGGSGLGLNNLKVAAGCNDTTGGDFINYGNNGTFFITASGGKAYFDEVILLVSVKATSLPSNFSLTINASGYTVTTDASGNITSYTYVNPSVSEQFGPADFIYGTQRWKPVYDPNYALWVGENTSDSANDSLLMFVDLYLGNMNQNTSLINNGVVRVDYQFQNLPGMAAFNAYGYRFNVVGTPGDGTIAWSNNTGTDGWKVMPEGSDIPTLSEWGLMILAAFLLVALMLLMRRPKRRQTSC